METVGISVVAATFGTTMVLVLRTHESSWLARSNVLRFFGRYSYGLYIIHGALMPVLLSYDPPWVQIYPIVGVFTLCAIRVAVCVPIALLSWHLIEAPALNFKRAFMPKMF
jgi:peptidoglycan/LPS O-acetylase OafA/YrhL